MITLKTTVNKIERTTTVTATHSQYGAIYSTWDNGTGGRVAARLQAQALQDAEQHVRRLQAAR